MRPSVENISPEMGKDIYKMLDDSGFPINKKLNTIGAILSTLIIEHSKDKKQCDEICIEFGTALLFRTREIFEDIVNEQ